MGNYSGNGTLTFNPAGAGQTVNFSGTFNSTGTVNFNGGANQIAISGTNAASFKNVNINNIHAAGISPTNDWTVDDFEAAAKKLREKGLAASAKRDDRENNQGLVAIAVDGGDLGQQLPRPDPGVGPPSQLHGQSHVFESGHGRNEVERLEQNAHVAAAEPGEAVFVHG